MTTQNTNAVNPSAILPFTAIYTAIVPSTELKPRILPTICVSLGNFATEAEAENACYTLPEHPAIIALQVSQNLRAYPEPLYYKAVCYFATTPNKDTPELHNGIGRYVGLFNTYSEALNACKPFASQPNYIGYAITDVWTQEGANHA